MIILFIASQPRQARQVHSGLSRLRSESAPAAAKPDALFETLGEA